MERTFRFRGPTEIFGTSFDRSPRVISVGRAEMPLLLSPAVADPGEAPPSDFSTKLRPEGPKKFFWRPDPPYPLYQGLHERPTRFPLIWRSVSIHHCPVPLFCILLTKKNNNQTSGLRNRNVPFHWARKITGIFVEWKVPRGVLLCVGQTKPHNQRYPCPKCNLARRKPLASHWWNLERWLADAFRQPLALESKRL